MGHRYAWSFFDFCKYAWEAMYACVPPVHAKPKRTLKLTGLGYVWDSGMMAFGVQDEGSGELGCE